MLCCVVLASACGGSGGGSSSSTTTGSVALVMTDAPTDEFVQVLVTFTRIVLLPADDSADNDQSGRQTIFDGRETIDLLALANVSEPFAIADDIQAGTYSKMRMEVEQIELVRTDGMGGFESEFARLPANGHIDLNAQGGFHVEPGTTLAVQLDIDARNSIQINATGNGQYLFRPQVFVDIMDSGLPARLISVEGVVREITEQDQDGQSRRRIWLCEIYLNHRDRYGDSDQHCLVVYADSNTSIFDESGLPATLDDIAMGDQIAVLGHFTTDEQERFALDAEVIELGGAQAFLVLTGVAASDYDGTTHSILFDIDPGQGLATDTSVEIAVSDETRFFSADGMAVDPADILEGSRLEVDGVLVLASSSPDLLRASVVFVREVPPPAP
jgi:hypothetical protein